jgi:hypothetical protein
VSTGATIRLGPLPTNRAHFDELWSFCADVLRVCSELGVEPIMNASLAVLAHTKCPDLEVHDVDLSCPEAAFARISDAFAGTDVTSEIMEWHVLELHRGDLKVEFDSAEVWMQGLSDVTDEFSHEGSTVRVVTREDLAILYRRGVEASEHATAPEGVARHEDLARKLALVEHR